MKRKLSIEVKDKKELAAIERSLADPPTRALVVVMGNLLALKSDRARERVLRFVADSLDESATP